MTSPLPHKYADLFPLMSDTDLNRLIDDPLGYVVDKNLHRRHLSESQRAMVASKMISGHIELRGRLPGPGAFATSRPSRSGLKEKSVS